MSTTTSASITTQHTPIKTRFLILSDTHASSPRQNSSNQDVAFRPSLPKADVLLHCGDLTMTGLLSEYEVALDMLENVDADLKLVIAGNHDITLDEVYYKRKGQYMHGYDYYQDLPRLAKEMWMGDRAKRAGVTYLDEGTHTFKLKNGASLRVYATPYQPEFCDWAFPYYRHEDRYNLDHHCTVGTSHIAKNPVPDFPAIDLLMSHGPPMHVLDAITSGESVGCQHLLRAVHRCKPRLHCFGHIHEGWGAQRVTWSQGDLNVHTTEYVEKAEHVDIDHEKVVEERAARVDISKGGGLELEFGKETLMVNASIMTVDYRPWNGPWLVDMDLERAE